jgi:hypothetical protein
VKLAPKWTRPLFQLWSRLRATLLLWVHAVRWHALEEMKKAPFSAKKTSPNFVRKRLKAISDFKIRLKLQIGSLFNRVFI